MNQQNQRTGGQILVAALQSQRVDRIYCVPGESYLPVLDALYDTDVDVISARHEGAAANMAEADGKLTGRPGVCFVTRGPGATHAAVGVHTAFQDSTPMLLFIGQVSRDAADRGGFQELDYRAMFAPLAKWAAQIDSAQRIPEYVARAFRTALSGRPGPVVLALPEDMLSERVETPPELPAAVTAATAVATAVAMATATTTSAAPRASDMQALQELLSRASRPLLIMGGSGWSNQGCEAIGQFAEANAIPILTSFRRQDLVDNRRANYCGHLGLGVDPRLAERLEAADLIIAIGSRLGENTTGGYAFLKVPVPRQNLVHVYPDPNELGRVYQPTVAIACGLDEFARALSALCLPPSKQRVDWLQEARDAYVRFSTPAPTQHGPVDLAFVMQWLNDHLRDDAIVCNGAGNYTVWVHRYFRYRQPHTQLAPTSGAMGYGVPAAIAAKLRHPDRQVIALAGDGCFLMYPQEIGTAAQHRAHVIVLIVNNGTYGTIRMHQERRYPGRVVATDILSPDFVELAQSLSAFGERVETNAAFAGAYERASAAGRPAVLELRVDPAQLTPGMRLAVPA